MCDSGAVVDASGPDVAALLAAAQEGDAESMFQLAKALTETDAALSREWYERAADAGDMRAMHNLANAYRQDGDLKSAEAWYRRAIEAGSVRSMGALGQILEKTDPIQAMAWFERGALEGNRWSMRHLADLLEESNPHEARIWRERANGDGDAWAAGRVAHRFLRRHPMSQSRHSKHHQNLMVLLERAAHLGHTYSMYVYGHRLYFDGDIERGREWLGKAADSGVPEARHGLTALGLDSSGNGNRLSRVLAFVRLVASIINGAVPKRRCPGLGSAE